MGTTSWAFAMPVQSGKEGLIAKEVPEHLRQNIDEVVASYKHHGLTLDRGYLMPSPMGSFYVQYNEATRPFDQVLTSFTESDMEIDRYINQTFAEASGIDLQEAGFTEPELIWEYGQPGTTRGRGVAFCAPVPERQTERLKAFFREAMSRTEELNASRTAVKITLERGYLNVGPDGDLLCVYLEGTDPVASNEAFAHSTQPYDVWFKKEAEQITGIDFNQPLPPIEQLWDWPANEG